MEKVKKLVMDLLPTVELNTLSSKAIVEQIALNIFESDFLKLREKEFFVNLPVVLQDIILIIDFDIELQMSGIIGFLENSTGNYFEETIEALYRINAIKDFKAMKNIKFLLFSNGIGTNTLREKLSNLSQYQVANSSLTHDKNVSDLLNEIASEADNLYLYRDDDNIFVSLFNYV
ncbi:DMP19 family protein [Paenibacillus planticolens]|uniref:DUF4375 domain-containing protein n=1 Tax=Paenibacillus planticolens TaxID=2654976 RepID=A0ABX1ZEW5_9BACL|nr:DUF4375 domain-containing protein [Paenibacillus planticolens]NOU98621.1 DUF4375 domain-containing protein [Paenibacillus planticolens]